MDIVVTGYQTPIAALFLIRGIRPFRRNVLWVHLKNVPGGTKQIEYYYEVIVKKNSDDVAAEKQMHKTINSVIRLLVGSTGENNAASKWNDFLFKTHQILSIPSTLMANAIHSLNISKIYYDCRDPNYVLKDIPWSETSDTDPCVPQGFVPPAPVNLWINFNYEKIDNREALIRYRVSTAQASGVFNALVDQAAGAFDLTSIITQIYSGAYLDEGEDFFEDEDESNTAKMLEELSSEENSDYLREVASTVSPNEAILKSLVEMIDDLNDNTTTLHYYYTAYIATSLAGLVVEEVTIGATISSWLKSFSLTAKAAKNNPNLRKAFAALMKGKAKFKETASGVISVYDKSGRFLFAFNHSGDILLHGSLPNINLQTSVIESTLPLAYSDALNSLKLYIVRNSDGTKEFIVTNADLIGEKIATKYNATNTPTSPFHYNPNLPANSVKRVVDNGSDPARLLDDNIKNKIDELPDDTKKELMDDLGAKTEETLADELDPSPTPTPEAEKHLDITEDLEIRPTEVVSPAGTPNGLAGKQHTLTPDHILAKKFLKDNNIKGISGNFYSLDAFVRIQKSPHWAKIQQLGIDVNVLTSIKGHYGAKYYEVINDIERFVDVLVKNSITVDGNSQFNKVINNLKSPQSYRRQGAHAVLLEFIENPELYKNMSIKFEVKLDLNMRATKSYVDFIATNNAGRELWVERKWYILLDDIISKDGVLIKKAGISPQTFLGQFVERDLYAAQDLFSIRWSVKGNKLTPEKVLEYLNLPDARIRLGQLHSQGRLRALVIDTSVPIDNVDDFINYLMKSDNFAKVFPQ